MNDSNNIKEGARQFKPATGSTVTYGLALFLSVHILGLFISSFDWIWHFPTIISLLTCLALGIPLNWLVFTFSPRTKKQ